ncbi:acyltransferase family protein [Pseudocolwellia agarivorans]|uniref:acyltransferase family protein n=1 Tax=Pseudocolwellia agarivorans TaxID=1911682 RepID=UPI003F88505B
MQFRNDINGLRAIAVIAVVIFHFNDNWLPGGFTGVDVFFVISGFLMTGIIFRGIEQGNFSILKFYISRANRIIPALALLCLVLLILGWFYLTPLDYKELGKHVLASITFISNIVYWKESGYFDAASHEKWLLHTWSLSAEWQFYIIYPLVLVFLRKIFSIKVMKRVILLGAILGYIFCIIVTANWPDPAYFLLPARAWEMMIGGVAYLYPLTVKRERSKLLEWTGLILILGSYFLISKDDLWPGYLSIFPVFGAFLIIQAHNNNSFITSNFIFKRIGQWSYSIYLWHWPLVVAIYYLSLNVFFIYLGIGLSVLLGFISYKYIEKFRFQNNFTTLSSYLKCKPIYFMLFSSLIGFYIYTYDGINHQIRSISTSEEAKYTSMYHRDNYKKYIFEAYRQDCNYFDSETSSAKVNSISETCTGNGEGGIFIWGDSHAQALSYGIRKIFINVNINQVASSGCRPLIEEDFKTNGEIKRACDRSNDMAKKVILKIKPKVIILTERFNLGDNNYNKILQYIKNNGLESKLLLIGPVPQWEPSLPNVISKRHFDVKNKVIQDASFVSEVFEVNNQLSTNYNDSEIEYVSIIDQLCSDKGCLAKVDDKNTPLVWDYGHLSLEGSIFITDRIMKDIINNYL